MIDGVQSAIFTAVSGVVEQFASGLRMRIGHDVMILKIIGSGRAWQVVRKSGLPPENVPHFRDEVLGIPVAGEHVVAGGQAPLATAAATAMARKAEATGSARQKTLFVLARLLARISAIQAPRIGMVTALAKGSVRIW